MDLGGIEGEIVLGHNRTADPEGCDGGNAKDGLVGLMHGETSEGDGVKAVNLRTLIISGATVSPNAGTENSMPST
ncbi:hypothetical protein GCM10009093_00710 [Brevundimonas terrae]|uniref:Uncharacterized protein n=1 Tax=Brevundimonas terrae TaxID=363631 RepID=A0ABP3HRK0_9CAUL